MKRLKKCAVRFIGILLLFEGCKAPHEPPEYELKENLIDRSKEVDVTLGPGAERPQNITTPPIPEIVTFAGDTIPLERGYVREALEQEIITNTFFHSRTIQIIKKFERWRPLITEVMNENQIPGDFIYLAVAESGLDNNALSVVGAMGMWQFMTGTARDYGLRVDKYVDMRRDPRLATEAACLYLLKAYSEVHDWPLVAATYNRGINGITDLLEEQKTDNFFDLHLNEETSRYLYRIISFKLILENPEAYGFFIGPEEKYRPYVFTTVTIDEDIDNLVDFAIEHGTTYKELRILNPWFNNTTNYKLNVPRNTTYDIRLPDSSTGRQQAANQ